ncbi:hypothetical protein JDV09_02225 [Mycobacterium sp. Y57]|uniref:hypothetical protein n=1 Tax=Mycolicibacterium xanthum TaxID=2796469 RepID=UPI001C864FC9|nr:hypothetical protein [Mycolicibacterium xanthum]MBX7430933.1 hypothetical protein [Mycolicibacterium xanthum]
MQDPHMVFRAVLALNALFASLAWCMARPNWASILAVVVSAALWPAANEVFEGRILLTLTPDNGVTTYDLLSAVAATVAVVQATRLVLSRKR